MRNAAVFGLFFVVSVVMVFGISGVVLADQSHSVEHTTQFASIPDVDTEADEDGTISGERIDDDIEADGDVVVTDGSRIMGDVEAEGDATIIDSRIDGDVEADGTIVVTDGSRVRDDVEAEGDATITASRVDGDVEADGDVVIEADSRIRGDIDAEGDTTITDSRVDDDVDTEGSARLTAGIINEDLDAEGTVELADRSRITGDIDAGGAVIISTHSEVDGEIDADGDVIDDQEGEGESGGNEGEGESGGNEGEGESGGNEGEGESGGNDGEGESGGNDEDERENEQESDSDEDGGQSDDDERERGGGGDEAERDTGGNEDERENEQESDSDEDEREGVFEISRASLSNTVITAGESLQTDVRVENVGNGDDTFETELLVDGETVDSGSATIEAGGTETIAFSYQFDDPGEYEIAVGDRVLDTVTVTPVDEAGSEIERSDDDATDIEILQATLPADWVREGYGTSVSVTVENTANRTANRPLTVTIDDQPVANETVTLGPYERDEMRIEFEATTGSVAVEGVGAGWIDTGELDAGAEANVEAEDTEDAAGFGFGAGIAALVVFVGILAGVAVLKPRVRRTT